MQQQRFSIHSTIDSINFCIISLKKWIYKDGVQSAKIMRISVTSSGKVIDFTVWKIPFVICQSCHLEYGKNVWKK